MVKVITAKLVKITYFRYGEDVKRTAVVTHRQSEDLKKFLRHSIKVVKVEDAPKGARRDYCLA